MMPACTKREESTLVKLTEAHIALELLMLWLWQNLLRLLFEVHALDYGSHKHGLSEGWQLLAATCTASAVIHFSKLNFTDSL